MPEEDLQWPVSTRPIQPPTSKTTTNIDSKLPTYPDPTQQQPTSEPLQAENAETSNHHNDNNHNDNNKLNSEEKVEIGSTTKLKESIDEEWVRAIKLKLTYLSRLERRLNHIDILGLER